MPIKLEKLYYEMDINNPPFRESSTMITYKDKIYLYGGLGTNIINELHYFDISIYFTKIYRKKLMEKS